MMKIILVDVKIPNDANLILGQTHFIKSVEDLREAIVTSLPKVKFGIAFAEASGPCLVRHDGNDDELRRAAIECCTTIGAGHVFAIFLREGYPINILNTIKNVQEVCSVYCATSNPVQVVVAEGDAGNGVLGVIDGNRPKGIEDESAMKERVQFLRKIGYKT